MGREVRKEENKQMTEITEIRLNSYKKYWYIHVYSYIAT